MKKAILLASLVFGAQTALAAGFEKGIPWGAQSAGIVGIATPYMTGSQALFFNPAGLAGDKAGAMDLSLNVSPTWPTFKAPIENSASTDTTKSQTYWPGSLLFGQTVNDKIGWGVGAYVAGGTSAQYDNIMFGTQGPFTAKSNLSIVEIAAGVGYKVTDDLKLGAAYRVAMVSGDFDSPTAITSGPLAGKVAQVNNDNLKATNYLGYKLGAQYKISDKTKFGLVYRSEMNFKAKGNYTVHVPAVGTLGDSSGDVTIGSVFPQAITLGAEHDCTETWKSYSEIIWTQYSKVTNLAVEQSGKSAVAQELQNKDQWAVRLAGAYEGFSWPIRFGGAWTSAVTNADHALPTGTPPGSQYTVTTGTGQAFGDFRVDGAVEYTWGSGTATGNTAASSVSSYSAHLGTSYTF